MLFIFLATLLLLLFPTFFLHYILTLPVLAAAPDSASPFPYYFFYSYLSYMPTYCSLVILFPFSMYTIFNFIAGKFPVF